MFGTTRNGWIGIDVGAASLKLAQLTRRGGGVELTKLADTPRTKGDDPVTSLRNDVETLLAVAGEIEGKRTAAVLSMESCRLESGHLGSDANEASDEPSPWSIASWPTGVETRDPDAGWYSLVAEAAHANAVADELLEVGLSCQTIDGGPTAVARALGMATTDADEAAVAGLDWGWSTATFVSAVNGYPVYARVLKDCGLNRMVTAVAEELGMKAEEAREAFIKHPPLVPGAKAGNDPLAAELSNLLRPRFSHLLTELNRTLTHVQTHRRPAAPGRLCLLGGGTLLPGVARWLERETQLATSVWQPAGMTVADSDASRQLPLFGPAIALSALRWEPR